MCQVPPQGCPATIERQTAVCLMTDKSPRFVKELHLARHQHGVTIWIEWEVGLQYNCPVLDYDNQHLLDVGIKACSMCGK